MQLFSLSDWSHMSLKHCDCCWWYLWWLCALPWCRYIYNPIWTWPMTRYSICVKRLGASPMWSIRRRQAIEGFRVLMTINWILSCRSPQSSTIFVLLPCSLLHHSFCASTWHWCIKALVDSAGRASSRRLWCCNTSVLQMRKWPHCLLLVNRNLILWSRHSRCRPHSVAWKM